MIHVNDYVITNISIYMDKIFQTNNTIFSNVIIIAITKKSNPLIVHRFTNTIRITKKKFLFLKTLCVQYFICYSQIWKREKYSAILIVKSRIFIQWNGLPF